MKAISVIFSAELEFCILYSLQYLNKNELICNILIVNNISNETVLKHTVFLV